MHGESNVEDLLLFLDMDVITPVKSDAQYATLRGHVHFEAVDFRLPSGFLPFMSFKTSQVSDVGLAWKSSLIKSSAVRTTKCQL